MASVMVVNFNRGEMHYDGKGDEPVPHHITRHVTTRVGIEEMFTQNP
ncbi:hypothetical protein VWY34_18520 [Phaeobacter sp. JH20_02]